MNVRSIFQLTATIALGVAGVAKLMSATLHASQGRDYFSEPDPIFGLTFYSMFLIVGALELTLAAACVCRIPPLAKMALIAFIATNFIAYRLGLILIGYRKPCSCLGGLTDALNIPPNIADSVMGGIAVYLALGSYIFLVSDMLAMRSSDQRPILS